MQPHDAIAALAPLVGTWAGPGRGSYPTITDFEYREEVTFADVGKPFLVYHQRTWTPDGRPLHVEMGYLRALGDGRVELTLAQPTGHVEIGHGTAEGDPVQVTLQCRIEGTDTAKPVEASRRVWRRDGDALVTAFAMQAVGQPMTSHLSSRLQRQG